MCTQTFSGLPRRGWVVCTRALSDVCGLDVPGVVAVAAYHALFFQRQIPARDHLSVCLSVCLSVWWPPLSSLVVEAAAAKLRHSLETKSTTDLAAVLARPEVDAVVITTASGAQLFWPLQPLGSTSLLRSLYWLPGFFAGSSECTHCSRLWDWQSWTS